MSKRPIPSVAADFDTVMQFLRGRGLVAASLRGELNGFAKRLHRATYSLILWRFRLKGLPDHGRVFIEEIASDALQILPQALMGYGKTVKLLTRGIVENTVRHVFFSDHPIEFAKMNREHRWYMDMDDLLKYPLEHPDFIGLESKFDAIARLRTLYDQLSAGVHGRRVQDLEMRTALNKIVFAESAFRKQVETVERCNEAAAFILATFHKERVRQFDHEDLQIVLRSMPVKARQIWRGLD